MNTPSPPPQKKKKKSSHARKKPPPPRSTVCTCTANWWTNDLNTIPHPTWYGLAGQSNCIVSHGIVCITYHCFDSLFVMYCIALYRIALDYIVGSVSPVWPYNVFHCIALYYIPMNCTACNTRRCAVLLCSVSDCVVLYERNVLHCIALLCISL